MCYTWNTLDNGKEWSTKMYNVVKRDGKIVDFDLSKISVAITQAFNACQKQYNPDIIDFLALKVTADFEPKIVDDMISSGESMLDVTKQLKERGAGRVIVFTTFGLFRIFVSSNTIPYPS